MLHFDAATRAAFWLLGTVDIALKGHRQLQDTVTVVQAAVLYPTSSNVVDTAHLQDCAATVARHIEECCRDHIVIPPSGRLEKQDACYRMLFRSPGQHGEILINIRLFFRHPAHNYLIKRTAASEWAPFPFREITERPRVTLNKVWVYELPIFRIEAAMILALRDSWAVEFLGHSTAPLPETMMQLKLEGGHANVNRLEKLAAGLPWQKIGELHMGAACALREVRHGHDKDFELRMIQLTALLKAGDEQNKASVPEHTALSVPKLRRLRPRAV
ncbi:hypothetical protein Rhopal_006395-T1 [Rhodotorula paludigena]|uniref:LAGLIDADG endonuclease n=1 Tax=Rhodotorula paludigena TaxID=86838 RepID=A0AAV5GVG4_9BASI|nr:hypothetical protein Rhopal_006395-T1 [Rhodotorula paludigena]